jgi:aspartyl-tRNA(Asn)/glutamyl-tRNA(Gln) amidotransferase subunit C
MALDRAAVAQIAVLARIRLAETELEPLTEELSQILTWIEQLNEVDTSGLPPMTSGAVSGALPMREDEVTDGGCREDVLGNAPRTSSGFFVVPKVIE